MKQKVLFSSSANSKIAAVGFIALLIVSGFVLGLYRSVMANGESIPQQRAAATATLQAASGQTIPFMTGNGQVIDDNPVVKKSLPQLVLRRNGQLTAAEERTLNITLTGLEVPPPGVTVTLTIDSQHSDPDLGDDTEQRIRLVAESRGIPNRTQTTMIDVATKYVLEFDAFVPSPTGMVPTPTDYFSYQIAVVEAGHPANTPSLLLQEEYAFLMENQWIAPLPAVAEETEGAAPDELAIYYFDMAPFQKDSGDPNTRLARVQIGEFVSNQLLPQMAEAFQMQSDGWDFTWYEAWTPYREGADAERLSVALSDGQTWYHGPAPIGGSAEISLSTQAQEYRYYNSLAEALLGTFHHELFHNLQRNISQHYDNQGPVSGVEGAWAFFTEGTATLVPTVAQPSAQFADHSEGRFFMAEANAFLGNGGVLSGLNTSYQRIRPYRAALYWRFLFENCGGLVKGKGNPAAGMAVIQRALETLYQGELIDINQSSDLVTHLPAIMDQALAATETCPFANYTDSLTKFAQSIAQLRLGSGALFDPHQQYVAPKADQITYTGEPQVHDSEKQLYPAGISSSFGIDFVDVMLDPVADGQALTIEVYGQPGSSTQFQVQVWQLVGKDVDGQPRRMDSAQLLAESNQAGHLVYTIPNIDTSQIDSLSLVITRVDTSESIDSVGDYTLLLN